MVDDLYQIRDQIRDQRMGEIMFQLRGGDRSLISKISGRPEARNETANPCLETESGFL